MTTIKRAFFLLCALLLILCQPINIAFAHDAESQTCRAFIGPPKNPGESDVDYQKRIAPLIKQYNDLGCTGGFASNGGSASSSGSQTSGGGINGFVYYCQGNPSWSNNCDLGTAGCGPTSLAMVMSTFGIKITPPEVDSIFQRNGWRAGCGAGSDIYSAIHSQWFLSQGFTVPDVDLIDNSGKPLLDQMQNYLNSGYLIIVNGHNYPCKGCIDQFSPVGHYFVVDQVDIGGHKMHTHDPNNCSYATGVENQALAWTDMNAPINSGGGADSTYDVYPILKK